MGGKSNRRIICACCGKPGMHGGHGWRRTCYSRWRVAGRPPEGPPPPQEPHADLALAEAREAVQDRKQQRKARAIQLHRDGGKPDQIARRLGVTERTVLRYLAEARADGETLDAAPAGQTPSGNRAEPRAHQGGSMKQTYRHDPDWAIDRIRRHPAAPTVGADSFLEQLGPVYADDLTPGQWRHVAGVAAGILVGVGVTDREELRGVLESLGPLDYAAPKRGLNGHLKGESGRDRARRAAQRRDAHKAAS